MGGAGQAAELLKHCNYLSIRQMVVYYSVVLVHKVLVQKAPVHLHQILRHALHSGVQHQYETRTAGMRQVAPARLAAANTSWRWRAAAQYAALPVELREEGSLQMFMSGLRKHVIAKVAI